MIRSWSKFVVGYCMVFVLAGLVMPFFANAQNKIGTCVTEAACTVTLQNYYDGLCQDDPTSCVRVKWYADASKCASLNGEPTGRCVVQPGAIKLQFPIPGMNGDVVQNGLAGYIVVVYKFFVGAASAAALVMILLGGYTWVTAGGNQAQIGNAKEFIIGAVIGLVLALGSYFILSFINRDLVLVDNFMIDVIIPPKIASNVLCDASAGTRALCGRTINTEDGFCRGTICANPNEECLESGDGLAAGGFECFNTTTLAGLKEACVKGQNEATMGIVNKKLSDMSAQERCGFSEGAGGYFFGRLLACESDYQQTQCAAGGNVCSGVQRVGGGLERTIYAKCFEGDTLSGVYSTDDEDSYFRAVCCVDDDGSDFELQWQSSPDS